MASNKNEGQQWMGPVQKGVEDSFANRPIGMPPLAAVKPETAKLGLPDSDAEAIYDYWLAGGYRLKGGTKIRDWRAVIRMWHRNGWFPSQKPDAQRLNTGAPPMRNVAHRPVFLTKDFVAEHFKARKNLNWRPIGRYCWDKLLANNWQWAKTPIADEERAHAVLEQIKEIYYREHP